MNLAAATRTSIVRRIHALAFFAILLLGWTSAALGQATHFQVLAPLGVTAGSPFSITVTALDAAAATVTGYAGTVHFSSSDPLATLPADTTLVNGTGTFLVTMATGGPQAVFAEEVGTPSINGSSVPITVAAAAHFTVNTPLGVTAGLSFSIGVQAIDQFGANAPNYNHVIHFSSSDPLAVLPPDTLIVNGFGSFTVTLNTGGPQGVFVEEVGNPPLNGSSAPITVAAAAHFTVATPLSVLAGTPFSFNVQAIDQFANPAPTYTGILHFTASDPLAVVPADTLIVNGFGSFTATFNTGGPQAIFVEQLGSLSLNGASGPFTVIPVATHFTVSAPGSATAGSGFSFTVTALDAANAVVTGYTGTVHFTSSDGQAVLPANATLTNGIGTLSATLKSAGNQAITATDTVTSITGTSGAIVVSPTAATHFTVSAPASAAGNAAFTFTVTALDQFNNTATGYAGTVHFISSDGAATLPANSTLTNGVGTFAATLQTGGGQTLTATDTVTASITGTSGTITVTLPPATHFTVSAPGSATAGAAFNFTVTALDATNATATSYAGTVHFTSSDGQAVLPANATLTNGIGTFSATLKTAGNQTITATDTVTASVTGTSNVVVVSAAAATHYSVSAPASATAGSAFNFTVTALDQFNNTATTYAGTVHFTSSDGAAVLPANSTLTNGVGTFSATLNTAGSRTITATDTVSASITGTSAAITVTAIAVTTFTGPSATGTGSITASFTGGAAGCTYVTPQFIPVTGAPRSPPAGTAPAGVTFPHGLFDFSTSGCTPGSTLTFTITYPVALTAGTQYWKYGPRTGQPAAWYVLPAVIAGSTVTFSITDGGLGDDDLAANGAIVDQGGPGFAPAGFGAVATPTLSEWAMALLALMLMGSALRSLQARRAKPNRRP